MIHGIYLDPRSWLVDCMSYDGWDPPSYGLNIKLYDENKQSKMTHINKECKFVIATEVWTPKMQKTLETLKNKYGLKVFMFPRETILADSYKHVMFRYPACKYKDRYFFNPDVVLSPGQHYTGFWEGQTKTINVGHPKFDSYITNKMPNIKELKAKYGICEDKKVVFFPAYWDKHYQYNNGVYYADIHNDLLETMITLEKVALDDEGIQIISKIHPTTQKLFNKGKLKLDKITKKYYDARGLIKIVKDVRTSVKESRELLYISDIVIGYKSTMLLEATLLGKPVINVVLDQCSKLKGIPDFVNHVSSVYSTKDLYDVLVNTGDYYRHIAKKSLVGEYFYKVDGNFCKRFCEAIKESM